MEVEPASGATAIPKKPNGTRDEVAASAPRWRVPRWSGPRPPSCILARGRVQGARADDQPNTSSPPKKGLTRKNATKNLTHDNSIPSHCCHATMPLSSCMHLALHALYHLYTYVRSMPSHRTHAPPAPQRHRIRGASYLHPAHASRRPLPGTHVENMPR